MALKLGLRVTECTGDELGTGAAAELVDLSREHSMSAFDSSDEDRMRSELSHEGMHLWRLYDGEALVGFAAWRRDEIHDSIVALLHELQVAAASRRRGIGSAIVAEIEMRARSIASCAGLATCVHEGNADGCRFFEALRFEGTETQAPAFCMVRPLDGLNARDAAKLRRGASG